MSAPAGVETKTAMRAITNSVRGMASSMLRTECFRPKRIAGLYGGPQGGVKPPRRSLPARRERQIALRIRRADVVRARPDQAVVRVLFEDVRGPARHPADREDRREQLDADPERV